MTTTANEFQNHIGGKWQGAESGQNFANYNPATGEILGYFPLSGEADANAAVAAARAAYEKWRLVPAPKRGEILFRVGELLKQHKEELARTMTPGDGQSSEGDTWRCARRHRHGLLYGRRRTQTLWL